MEAQEQLRRIEEEIVEDVLRKEIPESIDENLKIAGWGRNGIDTEPGLKVERGSCPCCSVSTGNEMIGLDQFYAGHLWRALAWFFGSVLILSALTFATGFGGLALGPLLSIASAPGMRTAYTAS